jgi:CBS domain containing-hemolysin-like protein
VEHLALLVMMGVLPVLLVLSGMCSGCETAFFSLSQHDRRRITRDGSLVANALTTLLAERRDLLITLLLANMTVNVLYFVISTVLLIRMQEDHGLSGGLLAVVSVVQLVVLILCGEVLPKLVAARLNVGWSQFAAVPVLLLHRVIGPLRVALNTVIVTPLARLIAPPRAAAELSVEEMEALLEMSQQRGVIDPSEEEMLQQVLTLGQLKVRDLMTPRVDVLGHNIQDDPARLIELIRSTGLTKIMVYDRDLDHVVGVAYARQVLLRRPRTVRELKPLVRQPMFVPELTRGDRLLVQFRKSGSTLAIAVDEYGGTAGLITLEDVVEQMVGDIAGPFQSNMPALVTQLSPGVWRVSGDLPVHEWRSAFGRLEQQSGVSTVGGLVTARLGRLARAGDRISVANVQIEVEKMDGRRPQTLLISIQAPPAGGQEAGT